MSTPTFTFNRGGESAEQASKSQGQFARTTFFSLKKDGDQMIVRFLTDDPDWLHVQQHLMAPTKNADPNMPFPMPESMPAVCRYDAGFGGFYHDCYICDAKLVDSWNRPAKPVLRVWALAAVREAVVENGVAKGYKDARIKVSMKRGGDTLEVEQRHIVVINMGMKNFFSGLRGFYGLYHTICDRDYVIQRSGTGKDTDYHIMPLDPIGDDAGRLSPEVVDARHTILLPEHPKWKVYREAIDEQKLHLSDLIESRASDEYFSKFFDPNKPYNWGANLITTNSSSDDTDETPMVSARPTEEPTPDKLAGMRERLQGYSSQEPPPGLLD